MATRGSTAARPSTNSPTQSLLRSIPWAELAALAGANHRRLPVEVNCGMARTTALAGAFMALAWTAVGTEHAEAQEGEREVTAPAAPENPTATASRPETTGIEDEDLSQQELRVLRVKLAQLRERHRPIADEALASMSRGTPRRDGVVSGWYGGLETARVVLTGAGQREALLSHGWAFGVRGALVFWDAVPLEMAIGGMWLDDRGAFGTEVMTCNGPPGLGQQCWDSRVEYSNLSGSGYVEIASGYQYRVRLGREASILPGLLAGYFGAFGFTRDLDECVDCGDTSRPVENFDSRGPFVAPFCRVTFGRLGAIGVSVRSRWFLIGAFQHVTSLSVDYGLP
jgi:hypothetical protein